MDCGSGLLLLLTRTIRGIDPGQVLLIHTQEPSVPPDLAAWAQLAGHTVVTSVLDVRDEQRSTWHVSIERGQPTPVTTDAASAVFSTAAATALGQRLWLYSNFHCNLACGYCCASSSPTADPRLLPVELAEAVSAEFAELGGRELLITGGEPFLHPDIGPLITRLAALTPVTVLTNAMAFTRGSRAAALEAMPRERVTLQVSLDSATAALHDRQRGPGSHPRALAGIAHARAQGFTVKVAATLREDETGSAAELHAFLDSIDIPRPDRLIRPVARQGAATAGQPISIDTVYPEPTVTVEGIWWHPVAVTDPGMKVADAPLPLAAALATIRDTLTAQNAASAQGRRHVFRCT